MRGKFTTESPEKKVCTLTDKIQKFEALGTLKLNLQHQGLSIVHCHGVFDLLHPGHIRHLQEAKKQGDVLVVSLTPDRFVNKGPGRPAFNEKLRLEQVASLSCVDYVVLNHTPDAVSVIRVLQPDIYVKGEEYRDHEKDVTGKISEESSAVKAHGGKIHYTNDIVFSSSSLINRYMDQDAERLAPFMGKFKTYFSLDNLLEAIDTFSHMKVLVVGDAIIDIYQYVELLGQSGKGIHLTARLDEQETFLGGSLIISNHLASFVKEVTLLTGVGYQCPSLPFMQSRFAKNIQKKWIYYTGHPTLTKKRYVSRDGKNLTKLFETYSSNEALLNETQTQEVTEFLASHSEAFDLVLVCDFGNGFTNHKIINSLCALPNFLAVNTQTNSGNRGYNVVTHYDRADFISLNEPELRLAAHDRVCSLEKVVDDIAHQLECPQVSVTRGVNGVAFYTRGEMIHIPALTMQAVDRVGAGDSYFALAALAAAKGYPSLLSGFLGSVAAAMDVQIVGNREAINRASLCKYIARLMK